MNNYIDYTREIYDAEAKALFSHRPDVKARHSRMTVKSKRKGNEVNADAILAFLSAVILFITYICMFFF